MTPDTLSRRAAHAEILLWQGKLRLAIALIAGAAEFVLLQAMGTGARSGWLFSAVAGYAAIVGVIAFGASRRHQVPEAAVTATVLADIAFIFAMTLVGSGPPYYDRILLAAFFALFAAALYFGRAHGLIGLVAAVLGYLLVVQRAVAGDGGLVWPEELFSLGVFVTATVAAFALCGSQHTRMDTIARLIERAEEGDFSVAYDEDADTRPDAVTAVGRSFNRVRQQLSHMVLTDPLTGCANRRGFDQDLGREMARAARAGTSLSLLAIDLDFFKAVNDSRGHMAGDAVLREVGVLLHRMARAGDVVARTGGEEFCMILPETTEEGARHAATRLVEAFRGQAFLAESRPVTLTVSIGVATVRPELGDRGVDEIKRRADDALYHAKRTGRDRVSLWTPSIAPRRSGMIETSSIPDA